MQPAARRKRKRRLSNGARGIIQEVEYLMDQDEIETAGLDGQRINIALPEFRTPDAGSLKIGTCDGQHGVAGIYTNQPAGPVGQKRQHATCSCPEIEQRRHAFRTDRIEDRGLNHVIRDMQGANSIPFHRMAIEIDLSGRGPSVTNRCQPAPVRGQHGIGAIQAIHQVPSQQSLGTTVGNSEKGPGAFAIAFDQAGFRHQLQVPGYARLGLTKNIREVGNAEFSLRQQRQHAQPRLLARRAQRADSGIEGQGGSIQS